MARVWRRLQEDALESTDFLRADLEDTLTKSAACMGLDCGDKGMKREMVEQRDQTYGLLLDKYFEIHPDQEAKGVGTWPERNKTASIWAICLPGPDTSLSSSEMGEVIAAHLVMPSPMFANRVGGRVKGHAQSTVSWKTWAQQVD